MRAFFRFLFSKVFLINVVLAGVVVVGGVYGVTEFLKEFTNHQQQIPVPNFKDVQIKDLDNFVENSNLRYVIIDSIVVKSANKGVVWSQDPLPTDESGQFVKENRKIYLTVTKTVSPQKSVPDFIGKSKRIVETIAGQIGLKIRTEYENFEDCRDCVLKMEWNGKQVKMGDKIPHDAELIVYYGKGRNFEEEESVPDLMGRTINQVRGVLSDKSLGFVTVYGKNVQSKLDSMSAVVKHQIPASGTSLRVGSKIRLSLELD